MNDSPSHSCRLSENRIKHYLELAKNACSYSDFNKTKLGAVVVYKNRAISVGWNLGNKTHPLQKEFNHLRGYDTEASNVNNTLHAEFHALIKIRHMDIDWKKVSVFVYRLKKAGEKGLARPCKACEGFMRELGICQVYYSTENGWAFERYE